MSLFRRSSVDIMRICLFYSRYCHILTGVGVILRDITLHLVFLCIFFKFDFLSDCCHHHSHTSVGVILRNITLHLVFLCIFFIWFSIGLYLCICPFVHLSVCLCCVVLCEFYSRRGSPIFLYKLHVDMQKSQINIGMI